MPILIILKTLCRPALESQICDYIHFFYTHLLSIPGAVGIGDTVRKNRYIPVLVELIF